MELANLPSVEEGAMLDEVAPAESQPRRQPAWPAALGIGHTTGLPSFLPSFLLAFVLALGFFAHAHTMAWRGEDREVRKIAGPPVQSALQPVCSETAPEVFLFAPSNPGFVEDPESRENHAAEAPAPSGSGDFGDWEPCTAPYRACVDGYRMPSTCAFPFNYNGHDYQNCASSSIGGSHWCSRDSVHHAWSRWDYCIPCTEQSIINETGQEAILRKIACTDIVITGGSMALEPTGRRAFTWINGFSPETTQATFPAFSAGKWPGTVAIAGAVHTGHLSWDTRAAEVFEWWTQDPEDPKWRVTLRNLLHFSSGFYGGTFMGHFIIPCMEIDNFLVPTTMEDCAKEVYEHASFNESRIGRWSDGNYHSMHQVIALAMATKRTGLCPTDYMKKYLYEPAAMTHTAVHPFARPIVAAFMLTTVDDYDSFLSKYLTYQILPKEIVDVIEADSGNGADFSINAMGHHVGGTMHRWGGSLAASVHRETQTYQLIVPPVAEYPGGAFAKWGQLQHLIESYLAQERLS